MHWCSDETNAVMQNIGMLPVLWMEAKRYIAYVWRWLEERWTQKQI